MSARTAREIQQTDDVIRQLDGLRVDLGISKAELARRIGRNASSIRRLFTASHARPELPLVAAIADALSAEVRVVRRSQGQRTVAHRDVSVDAQPQKIPVGSASTSARSGSTLSLDPTSS